MGEIRRDYVLDRYVIINGERGRRPLQFCQEPVVSGGECPFCPVNEHLLPPVKYSLPLGDEHAGVRIVPNKYPIVSKRGDGTLRTHNDYYTFADSYGEHLVVIEGVVHGIPTYSFSEEQLLSVLLAYQAVYEYLYGRGAVHVCLFKNEGLEAGASIDHPHSQAVSLPLTPQGMLARYKSYDDLKHVRGACPYCEVLLRERDSFRRVAHGSGWTVFCPYASPNPFDTVFFPDRHVPRFIELSVDELRGLAKHLKHVLTRLGSLNAPYNLEVIDGSSAKDFHCHVVVTPRLKKEAGFEHETGIIVNPLPPEEAADFLR